MIRFMFIGDVALSDHYDSLLEKKGPRFPFEKIKGKLKGADLVVANLESPLCSPDHKPVFKMKTPLKGNIRYIEGLKWAGFHVLNLSNNHILDYGEEAVFETKKALEDNGLLHFGYGNDISTAKQMCVITIHELKVGLVGYTDVVIDSPFFADNNSRGVVKFDIEQAIEDIRCNKKQVDMLIINIHWGVEYFNLPSPDQIKNAKKMIDAGADIIIGHHPHVLQGIQKYKHGLIAYSLGNFAFSEINWQWFTSDGEKRVTKYELKKENRESVILNVEIIDGVLNYYPIGTQLKLNGQIDLNNQSERKLEMLSKKILYDDYEIYFKKSLRRFYRKRSLLNFIKRFRHLNKLRPKHFKDLLHFVRNGN